MTWYRKILKPFGSLKAAVLIIFLLAAVLTLGTIVESYYHRTYAYNLVYGSILFHLLLLFLAVNILAAALIRLPFKKRLAGFYLSHIGLLVLLAGSLMTLLMGIDGTLTLPPDEVNGTVRLEDPVLYAQGAGQKPTQVALPKTVFPKKMNQQILLGNSSFKIRRFLPYAKETIFYEEFPRLKASGMEFTLLAPQVTQPGVLSSPPSQFPDQLQLGPLSLHYLGELPPQCSFPEMMPTSGWFFMTPDNCRLIPKIPDQGITLDSGEQIMPIDLLKGFGAFKLNLPHQAYLLIPQISAWPIREKPMPGDMPDIAPDFRSSYRLYRAVDLFRDNTVLFHLKNSVLQMGILDVPKPVQWTPVDLTQQTEFPLPWMKLNIFIDQIGAGLPYRHFIPTKPIPGESDKQSALAIESNDQIFWLKSGEPFRPIGLDGEKTAEMFLGYRTFPLPWQFQLDRFKMDTDPGTNNPASYESFVKILEHHPQATSEAHIFMNNPLKKGKYTFYQASYFSMGNTGGGMGNHESFGSILQVNYDPGRWPKYAGSLIIVLGTILHFYIRRARRGPKPTK